MIPIIHGTAISKCSQEGFCQLNPGFGIFSSASMVIIVQGVSRSLAITDHSVSYAPPEVNECNGDVATVEQSLDSP
jgi:hypothetical protein